MADRDKVQVELSSGMQPRGAPGDRILVGLAILALGAGGLVAVSNLLPDETDLATASASQLSIATRTSRPTPTAGSPRVAIVEQPEREIFPPVESPGYAGWIRAKVDLAIHATPDADASVLGLLAAGDIAFGEQQGQPSEDPGWLSLQEPQSGWISTMRGQTQLVQRYPYPEPPYSGTVTGLVAGPDGFLALYQPPSDPPNYPSTLPAVSTDGDAWASGRSPAFSGWDMLSAAWGPSGWLGVTFASDGTSNQILVWNSRDGLRWTRLGVLGGVPGEYPDRVLGSERGYLLATSQTQGEGGTSLWSSADGLSWTETLDSVIRLLAYRGPRSVAVPRGFYLYSPTSIGASSSSPVAAFSVDGQAWIEVASGPSGPNLQVSGAGQRMVAIDMDPFSGAPRVWVGTLDGDPVAWLRRPEADAPFGGSVVTELVSDREQFFAFGWDRSTEAPLVWTGDGLSWHREALPASFGGLPQMAAAGPTGVVVVGHRPTLRGDNPILYRRTPTGRWLPEPEPLMTAVPDPAADECVPPPSDSLAFSVLDLTTVPLCFGSSPITFRAWSSNCQGCGAGSAGEPAWLITPTHTLYLSPIAMGGLGTLVVVSPSLEMHEAWTDAWVQVTGHFDDPAALSCHFEPSAEELQYWGGQQSGIDLCRQKFVVTEVVVVPPP
jgi:hypothetical protein